MSYSIEHGKRVLTITDPEHKRFGRYVDSGELLLFLMSSASNNVSPRRYDWRVFASDDFSDWGGEIQMPTRVWELGAAADGGGIQPYNKCVSGLSYLKAWKLAAAKRAPMIGPDDSVLWAPDVAMNVGYAYDDASRKHWDERAAEFNAKGAAEFGKHDAEQLHAAFKRLFPDPIERGYNPTFLRTAAAVRDAVYLWINRSAIPFGFELRADEMRKPPQLTASNAHLCWRKGQPACAAGA
jgi:hypothetical protein